APRVEMYCKGMVQMGSGRCLAAFKGYGNLRRTGIAMQKLIDTEMADESPAHLTPPFLYGSMPWRASSSARSFMSWPAWPLTQCHLISWCLAASSRRCQSSMFLTGFLSAVFQPLRFQPFIQ